MGSPTSIRASALGAAACGELVWRSGGEWRITAIVKATFALEHEAPMRLVAPEPITVAEIHHRGNPGQSVRVTTDLVPHLPCCDVVLTGHAYAPPGRAVERLAVRLRLVGDAVLLDKAFDVLGDEGPAGVVPFQRMPLVLERALGGLGHPDNPFGIGVGRGTRPNLVDPADPDRTVCFGPLARAWPQRRRLVSPEVRRRLEAPVPDVPGDVDWSYFQSAPLDQRVEGLAGDEWLELEGLHPALGRVRSRLPGATAAARLETPGAPPRPIVLVADTLRIDSDAQTCTVAWRGWVRLSETGECRLVGAVAVEGMPIDWSREPGEQAPTAAVAPADFSGSATMSLGDAELDFVEEATGEPTTADASHLESTRALSADELAMATAPPTPFAAPSAQPPESPPRVEHPLATTRALSADEQARVSGEPAAPFVAGAGEVPVSLAPPDRVDQARWAAASPLETTMAVSAESLARAGRDAPTPFHTPLVQELATLEGVQGIEVADASRWFHTLRRPDAPVADRKPPAPLLPERTGESIPVINRTSLVLTTLAWQVRPPHPSLAIIAKGTFDLVPGAPARRRAASDHLTGDLYWDDDPLKSVRYPSDFAIFKPRADVTLTGHAHAPGGSAPTSVVGFRFGRSPNRFDRRVAVFGPRTWRRSMLGLAPGEPGTFDNLPLRYEHAYGGAGFAPNPVGVGHKGSPGDPLPALEDPGHLTLSPSAGSEPACFAPISTFWKSRWARLGSYDAKWLASRWPYFPENFDWLHFQAAPAGQQLDHLTGDEPFEILGMHPEHERIAGSLPGLRVRCFVQRTVAAGGTFSEVVLRLDTAAFDADAMKVDLVWRGLLEVTDEDAPEMQALFLMATDLGEPPLTLSAARDVLLATLVSDPVVEADVPAANEVAPPPPPDPALVELEQALEARKRARDEQLRAMGLSDEQYAEITAPPGAPGDPQAVLEALRESGRPELCDELAAILRPRPDAPVDPTKREVVLARLGAGEALDGMDLEGADLSGLDLAGQSLVKTNLARARLAATNLAGADCREATFGDADLTDAILTGARLDGADLYRATLEQARFDKTSLAFARFDRVKGPGARFEGARGERASFSDATLPGACFDGAELPGVDFMHADLERASFAGAKMERALLFHARGEKVRFDGAVLERAGAEGASFARGSFRAVRADESTWEKAELTAASFEGASLRSASFVRATCAGVVFTRSDARGSCFRRAVLAGVHMLETDLMEGSIEGADLSGADLRGANLHGCETWKAKLATARLEGAITTKTKLRGAR